MRNLLFILVIGILPFIMSMAPSCLDTFNQAIHDAWDQYDLDYYNCHIQGLSAHPDCERDAMDQLAVSQTLAVISFDYCCQTTPGCD